LFLNEQAMNDTAIYTSESPVTIVNLKCSAELSGVRLGFIGMEEAMRRTILATAATLAILSVGSLVPNQAGAMTVATPAGIKAAIEGTNLIQDVACRRIWRCGPYGGCAWRRVCWGGPAYYGYGGPYYGGGPSYYGGGPYWRPYRRYWW
jgi:hypothetical protein